MTKSEIQRLVDSMFAHITADLPNYKDIDPNWAICEGNVACCIIDAEGNIYGKIWGQDKLKGRKYYDIAYRKAVQVWITGHNTKDYEKLVFSDQINPKDFGIELPDLIGWEGGQLIKLDNQSAIACGFSGLRGVHDLKLVKDAANHALAH